MFDLKKPCKDCPFIKGNGEKFQLHPERLTEIFTATAFQCHKTLDGKPQQCAGLMSVLASECRPNQIMRIAARVGHLDMEKIVSDKAYGSFEEVRQAHREEQ